MDQQPILPPQRITAVFLDVVEYLLTNPGVHGWAVWHGTRNRSASVYSVLGRLDANGWVTSEWLGHRKRAYTLTAEGEAAAKELLARRRPPDTIAA